MGFPQPQLAGFPASSTASNSITADPVNTTLTPLEIRDSGAGRSGTAQEFQIFDRLGNPIFSVPPFGGPTVYGDRIGARVTIFSNELALDATVNPPAILAPNVGVAPFNHFWITTGTPTATLAAQPAVANDVYWQLDGADGARVFVCTVSGTPGTWVAKL